jgi:hypothetical protein
LEAECCGEYFDLTGRVKQESENTQLHIEEISNLYSSRNIIWDDQIKEGEGDEKSIQKFSRKL